MAVHPALEQIEHRPWTLPAAPWQWRQSWLDLAFVHFEVDPDDLRPLLPRGVELELFEGKAWLGIVPFRMEGVTRRGWPAPSLFCDFPELNVRTYVTDGAKPGVWFFSLLAPHHAAVWFARKFFKLPYYYAAIRATETKKGIHYEARRGSRTFVADYAPGKNVRAEPGSFSQWATERYCLYSANRAGIVFRGEVHHHLWPLQEASITIHENTISGMDLGAMHPTVLFSRRIDVVLWSLDPVR